MFSLKMFVCSSSLKWMFPVNSSNLKVSLFTFLICQSPVTAGNNIPFCVFLCSISGSLLSSCAEICVGMPHTAWTYDLDTHRQLSPGHVVLGLLWLQVVRWSGVARLHFPCDLWPPGSWGSKRKNIWTPGRAQSDSYNSALPLSISVSLAFWHAHSISHLV